MNRQSLRWDQLRVFTVACEEIGIEPPQPITTGLHLVAVANQHGNTPTGGLLAMTDDEVRDRVTDLSIRQHRGQESAASSKGLTPGIRAFREELAAEVADAIGPDLERITVALQPQFAEAAAPLVHAARKYGFTASTDPGEVIDMADEKASAAYWEMRAAWIAIQPIATFRITMSTTFDLSPNVAETTAAVYGDTPPPSTPPINWSVLFAEGENWSLDTGYIVEGRRGNQLDWLALAAGGLRLNTPEEARAKVAARE